MLGQQKSSSQRLVTSGSSNSESANADSHWRFTTRHLKSKKKKDKNNEDMNTNHGDNKASDSSHHHHHHHHHHHQVNQQLSRRLRADSNDSTRRAFYHHQDMPQKSNFFQLWSTGATTSSNESLDAGEAAGADRRRKRKNKQKQQLQHRTSTSTLQFAGEDGAQGVAVTDAAASNYSMNKEDNLMTMAELGQVDDQQPKEANPLEDIEIRGTSSMASFRNRRSSDKYFMNPPPSRKNGMGVRENPAYDSLALSEDASPDGGERRSLNNRMQSLYGSAILEGIYGSGLLNNDESSTAQPTRESIMAQRFSIPHSSSPTMGNPLSDSRSPSAHEPSTYQQWSRNSITRASGPRSSGISPVSGLHLSRPHEHLQQSRDIALFSSLARGVPTLQQPLQQNEPQHVQNDLDGMYSYLTSGEHGDTQPLLPLSQPPPPLQLTRPSTSNATSRGDSNSSPVNVDGDYSFKNDETSSGSGNEYGNGDDYSSLLNDDDSVQLTFVGRIMTVLDPTPWLTHDIKLNDDGIHHFDQKGAEWWSSAAGFVRHFFWNPLNPEFTSLQLFCWAVVIGAVMGVYTALWKWFIEFCIELMWVTVPSKLLKWGVFTDLNGWFPLYHYMWICPASMGGILSYIMVILPVKIPDQNDWIRNVHTRGVQDYRAFWNVIFLSTAGMASGLSLGPELPLVLTAGMAGSWLGLVCKQSILQARVMNLTAASAAVAGFFGFPMAGALFVLELPHRMGLQYFEALSPATISSIVAVLSNRLMVGNDVTGYYRYPFLTATLPSEILSSAVVYGFWGAAVGIVYVSCCKKLKGFVHDLFHAQHHEDHQPQMVAAVSNGDVAATDNRNSMNGQVKPPLIERNGGPQQTYGQGLTVTDMFKKCLCCTIPNKATRAAVAGTLAGAVVGCICMFVPHSMFWGEAQLQTLIDKGRTPLPVFGIGEEPTAALVALGQCMIDPEDEVALNSGFGVECSLLITAAKIITTGLSLGTGIIGGHFWGPLFVGCSSGHFLTAIVQAFSAKTGYGGRLATYPCVVILCTMGSTHVVSFRAHMAIMLILTLTISAFDAEDISTGRNGIGAGDYSAVFPLLVVSVFVSLMVSRGTVFYPTQQSRGDIMAVPEVLCEPGMKGQPMVLDYEGAPKDETSDSDFEGAGGQDLMSIKSSKREVSRRALSQAQIERDFAQVVSTTVPSPTDRIELAFSSVSHPVPQQLTSARLDELMSYPYERSERLKAGPNLSASSRSHRRIHSAPTGDVQKVTASKNTTEFKRFGSGHEEGAKLKRERCNSGSSSVSKSLVRVSAFGEVQELQPSLLDQARNRAASASEDSRHSRASSFSKGRHSRKNSESSVAGGSCSGDTKRPPMSSSMHARKSSEPLPHLAKPSSASPRLVRQHNSTPSIVVLEATAAASSASTLGGALTLDDIDRTFDAQIESLLATMSL